MYYIVIGQLTGTICSLFLVFYCWILFSGEAIAPEGMTRVVFHLLQNGRAR